MVVSSKPPPMRPLPEGLALQLLQAARHAFREDDRAVMNLLFDLVEAEQRQELRK